MSATHSPGKITVDEYYEMARVGLIDPDARVELIDGEIVAMAPIGNPHGYVVDMLVERLWTVLRGRAHVRAQGALRLSNRTEFQPDISVLKLPSEQYRERQATASDVLLVIEVCDTTLGNDMRVKVPLYARHGVPEVWLVDLKKNCVRFYRSLVDGQYRDVSLAVDPDTASIPGLVNTKVDLTRLIQS